MEKEQIKFCIHQMVLHGLLQHQVIQLLQTRVLHLHGVGVCGLLVVLLVVLEGINLHIRMMVLHGQAHHLEIQLLQVYVLQ